MHQARHIKRHGNPRRTRKKKKRIAWNDPPTLSEEVVVMEVT